MSIRRVVFSCAVVMLCGVVSADAAVIQLLPSTHTVSPGDTVALDLVVSSLGGALVGDFDVDIAFDPVRLTLDSYSLGTGLGNVAAGDALEFSLGMFAPGRLNLAEVSVLGQASLAPLQQAPLVLASFVLRVGPLAPGASTLVAVSGVNALGDAAGVPIAVTDTANATLSRPGGTPPPGAVPEPHAIALLGVGLLWGAASRRRRQPRV